MQCSIRDTTVDDVPAIFALRLDRKVLRQQYKPGLFDTPRSFSRNLTRGLDKFGIGFKCMSILVDDNLVGHVIQHYLPLGAARVCYCGWNLAPSYWGRGIMPYALMMLFDDLFGNRQIDSIRASCFVTNTRCLRVLEKLGFRAERLGKLNRLGRHVGTWLGFRNVKPFRLTAQQWREKRMKAEG